MIRKGILAILMIVMLTGCGLMDKQTATKTTAVLNDQGETTQVIVEDQVVGDKYTNYTIAVPQVATAAASVSIKKIEVIASTLESEDGESGETTAYKKAMGVLAISNVKNEVPDAIRAIHYGKDSHDNIDTALGVVGGVATTGIFTYGAVEGVKALTSNIGGDVSFGDGAVLDESFNKESLENHSTTGRGNPIATVDKPLDRSTTEIEKTEELPEDI